MTEINFAAKGTHAIQVRAWVDGRRGEGTFLRLMRAQDPAWPERILQLNWYPVRPMIETINAVMDGSEEDLETIVAEISATNAEEDLRAIYKAFLWVAGPSKLFSMAKVVWGAYSTFGSVELLTNEPGRYEAVVSELPEDLLAWCSGCWLGFVPVAAEFAGAKNPRGRILARESKGNRWQFHIQILYDAE